MTNSFFRDKIETSSTPKECFLKSLIKMIKNITFIKKRYLLKRSFRILKKVADRQIELFNEFEESKKTKKGIRHLYFFSIVKSFWEDGDFSFFLGKTKYLDYSVYPARTMMEKLLKILWFSNEDERGQDAIAIKELSSNCLLSYKKEKEEGKTGKEYREDFDFFRSLDDALQIPDINNVKFKDLKPFPTYEVLCNKSGMCDAEKHYDIYRYLSGRPHGELFSIIIKNAGKEEEFIRWTLCIIRWCIEMIQMADFHLGGKTKKEILVAKRKCEKIKNKILQLE